MKRIVIAINNSEYSNQFALTDFHGIIQNPKHGEIEYFVHRNPLMKISAVGGLKKNFDVLINNPYPGESNEGADFISLLHPHQIFTNKREAKSIMRHHLNRVGGHYKDFVTIPAWKTTDTLLAGQTGGWGNDIEGEVVLKDEHGARGLGQVKFNVAKHSPACVIKAIKEQAKSLPQTDEEIIEGIKSSVPHVNIGYDLDVGVVETIEALSANDTYIEQFVPNVRKEYRILVSPGDYYVFKREIETVDGYNQACGSKGGMQSPDMDPKVLSIASDAVNILNKIGVVYGSVDLFLTDKGWGIFEYSSQFGANGVASSFSRSVQVCLINHVIERYLDGEKKMMKRSDIDKLLAIPYIQELLEDAGHSAECFRKNVEASIPEETPNALSVDAKGEDPLNGRYNCERSGLLTGGKNLPTVCLFAGKERICGLSYQNLLLEQEVKRLKGQ